MAQLELKQKKKKEWEMRITSHIYISPPRMYVPSQLAERALLVSAGKL